VQIPVRAVVVQTPLAVFDVKELLIWTVDQWRVILRPECPESKALMVFEDRAWFAGMIGITTGQDSSRDNGIVHDLGVGEKGIPDEAVDLNARLLIRRQLANLRMSFRSH
jgi:hypothetical protein